MAKIDKIKEEIGWLKVVFGVLLVTDISLVAWIAQNYNSVPDFILTLCVVGIFTITLAIGWVNKGAYRRIDKLEDR